MVVETIGYKTRELITKFKINETQKLLIIVQLFSSSNYSC